MRADKAPESAEEFERLVLASPRSSFVWIKYMALHLEMTEIEKAREVCPADTIKSERQRPGKGHLRLILIQCALY